MADFVTPTSGFSAPPDVLSAYLRGQLAPGQVIQQQQQVAGNNQALQQGALNIQQLQQAMKFNQWKNGAIQGTVASLQGQPTGGTQDAGASGGGTGGIQNGPQGAVSAVPNSNPNAPVSANGVQPGGDGWAGGGYTSNHQRQILGMLAPEMLKGMDEGQTSDLKNAQIQSSQPGTPLSVLKGLASDPNADQMLMNNPQLLAHWPAVARQYGVDPTQITPINVRRVATLAANQQLTALQLPPLSMPEHVTNVNGQYGQQLQVDDQTGKASQVAGRELPTFAQSKTYNPQTGKEDTSLFQSGGLDAHGRPLQAGSQVSSTLTAPTADNVKQAAFASSMQSGLQVMRNLENKGVALSPTQRASLIDVATNEDPGAIHAWLSQESLKHALTAQQQSYIAGMFPVIQAVSHDQAGARVTTSQLRMNLESIIPVDANNKDAMAVINKTRNNFQNSMNIGAGSAAQTPEFNQTVGAARRAAAANTNAPPAALNYLKAHPEAADHFKQKYGYLPGG